MEIHVLSWPDRVCWVQGGLHKDGARPPKSNKPEAILLQKTESRKIKKIIINLHEAQQAYQLAETTARNELCLAVTKGSFLTQLSMVGAPSIRSEERKFYNLKIKLSYRLPYFTIPINRAFQLH